MTEITTTVIDEIAAEEQFGAFAAYLRRPDPKENGYIAKFFGENGEDADLITALSLTRFLDRLVKINVFLIKDKNGKLAREDGKYPLIASFHSSIKRPKSSNTGQCAQFFAENGENADVVSELGKTAIQDSLVYVEVLPAREEESKVEMSDIDQYSTKILNFEKKLLEKNKKKIQEANRILGNSGFFKNESVIRMIGREEDYQNWLTKQPCCFPSAEQCEKKNIIAFKVPGHTKAYRYTCLCEDHAKAFDGENVSFPQKGEPFLLSRFNHLIQEWVKETLLMKFGLTKHDEIYPVKLIEWATEKKLQNLIPPTYYNTMGMS